MNEINRTCLCLPSRSWTSFTDPGGMEGWVGLGVATVSIRSARDCYVTESAVVSYWNRHASLGNWSTAAMGVELATSRVASRDANHANHCVTESPCVHCLLYFRLQRKNANYETVVGCDWSVRIYCQHSCSRNNAIKTQAESRTDNNAHSPRHYSSCTYMYIQEAVAS